MRKAVNDNNHRVDGATENRCRHFSVLGPGGLFMVLFLLTLATAHAVTARSLESMSYTTLPGERVELALKFDGAPPEPLAFTIDNPARIALDFPNTQNRLNKRSRDIGIGLVRSVNTAQAKGRTRVVINLAKLVGYQTRVAGDELIISFGDGAAVAAAGRGAAPAATAGASQVNNVDFHRGPGGEGRVIVTLSDPNIPVDVREQGGKILVDITGAELPAELQRRQDVLDFATPVSTIDTYQEGDVVHLVIQPHGDYEHLAYQTDNVFTVEVREVPKVVQEQRKKQHFKGERLSLNFQDIETRAVLQLIADFTGLNLVVSDSVSGNLTLRLKNVPWDQALDIILKTKGLAMRQTGKVLLVAPAEEIAAREKLELEAQKQVKELEPLRMEIIQVNYARAADVATLLKAPENSLLGERGSVAIDVRTNTLLVQDTSDKLAEIRDLVKRLDVPVRQVLIESRIVIAQDNFSKELGVRFGVTQGDTDSRQGGTGQKGHFLTGNLNGTTDLINGDPLSLDDSLNVNLPVVNPSGSFGLALAKLPLGYLVELELSAAQAESRVEIVSTPRVITSNQTQARIERGTEIPYQEASSSGATSTSFKKAVLSLEVTPQITPDDRVFMDLQVTNDNVGREFDGIPSIDTRAVETQVLVDNGQTVVLGGIFDTNSVESSDSVPFFGDLPLLGHLFRKDSTTQEKAELLIFITPKIISENLTLAP
jgi:type IV pilus assembly protein PilQ